MMVVPFLVPLYVECCLGNEPALKLPDVILRHLPPIPGNIRELKQTMMTTATRKSPNKRFNAKQ